MSIILEALRKSERERRLGQIPTLESGNPAPMPLRGLATRLAAFALLVLLAGGAYWWWVHPRPETGRSAESAATVPAGKTQPAIAPPRAAEKAPPIPAEPHGENRLSPVAGEPPASVPPRTPPLVLNALSWSEDPKRRFVMINQAIVREGQLLPGGATLHEITREGAVLEFQGQRFTLRP